MDKVQELSEALPLSSQPFLNVEVNECKERLVHKMNKGLYAEGY